MEKKYFKHEMRNKILKFKLLNVDYHEERLATREQNEERKFINQFALLDHTSLMRRKNDILLIPTILIKRL